MICTTQLTAAFPLIDPDIIKHNIFSHVSFQLHRRLPSLTHPDVIKYEIFPHISFWLHR